MELEELKVSGSCNKEQLTLIDIVISNIITDYLQKTLDFEQLKLIQADYVKLANNFANGEPPQVWEVFQQICEWKRNIEEICEQNRNCEKLLAKYVLKLEKMFYNLGFLKDVVCQENEENDEQENDEMTVM